MPSKSEMIRWQEEQNRRLSEGKKPESFGEWRTRVNREVDDLRKREQEETKQRMLKETKRVNAVIKRYFLPELDGEMLSWDDRAGAHRFSRWNLGKMLQEFDIAHDGNIFPYGTGWILKASDEELLAVLSQNLPVKPFYYSIPQKDGSIKEATIRFKRMLKP